MKKRYLWLIPLLASCAQQQAGTVVQHFVKASMSGDMAGVHALSDKEFRQKNKLEDLKKLLPAEDELAMARLIASYVTVDVGKLEQKDNIITAKIKLKGIDFQQFAGGIAAEMTEVLQAVQAENASLDPQALETKIVQERNEFIRQKLAEAYRKGTLSFKSQEANLPLIKEGWDWKIYASKPQP